MNLTHKKLVSINGKPYNGKSEISDENGLSLRISPKGKISFQLKYRINGKLTRYKIGTFPKMSLSDAREKAEEDLEWVSEGRDPRNRGLLTIEKKALTLRGAIDYWYENYAQNTRDKPEKIIANFDSLIPKEWMNVNIEQMAAVDWVNLYKGIASNNSTGHGQNTIIELRTVIRFCIGQGKAERADFESLKPSNFCSPYESRERALDPDELGLIFRELPNTRLEERNQIVVRMVFVFGCRLNEIALAEKSHFDLEKRLWTVPKENLKGGRRKGSGVRAVRRPIPLKFVPYIKRLMELSDNKYLVRNRRRIDKPVSSSSLSKISIVLREDLGMDHWQMHDGRRTLSTLLSDLKCPPYITEKMIGHVLRGTMAIYNRSDMLAEMDEWMTIWYDKLELWEKNHTNIIDINKAKTAS